MNDDSLSKPKMLDSASFPGYEPGDFMPQSNGKFPYRRNTITIV
jgi:hypothetical protein